MSVPDIAKRFASSEWAPGVGVLAITVGGATADVLLLSAMKGWAWSRPIRITVFFVVLAAIAALCIVYANKVQAFASRTIAQDEASEYAARIQRLQQLMTETVSLQKQLHAETQLRITAMERLREDAERYEQLAQVNAKEAEAVSQLVREVVHGATGRMERSARWQSLIYFVLGAAVGVIAPLLTRWMFGVS